MGKYMDYYCSLSLTELRRRQYITGLQIKIAYRGKKTKALIKLQRISRLLAAAVMKTYL